MERPWPHGLFTMGFLKRDGFDIKLFIPGLKPYVQS